MDGLLLTVVLLVGVIGIYILTYYMNKNTAVPEGTKVIDVGCSTCGSSKSCSLKPVEKETCELKEE